MSSNYLKVYLNEHKYFYLIVLLLSFLFILYNFLFQIPFIITIYWLIIEFILILIISLFDYSFRKKKYLKLKSLLELSNLDLYEQLKIINFKSSEENELIKIINQLNSQLIELIDLNNKKYSEINDYILTWLHQIKLPITAIRLLIEDEDTTLSREIKSEVFRIELYIEMILTYFQLNSPTTDYIFEKVDLKGLIQEEIKKFSSEFIKRGLSVEIDIDSTEIIIDQKWLCFILDQLLSNALKYTFKGKIKISFSNNQLKITDTGIGINSSDLPRIFERGYTGYNGRTNKKASGLGLYLTKQVCLNLEIPIAISSELNKGTEVILNFDRLIYKNFISFD